MPSRIEINSIKGIPSELPFTSDASSGFEVTEYGDRSLCVQTKTRVAEGQLLSLDGTIWDKSGFPFIFQATGKIVSRMEAPEGFSRIEIHLHQFDRDLWGKFLEGQNVRQNRVDHLLKAMKGEE